MAEAPDGAVVSVAPAAPAKHGQDDRVFRALVEGVSDYGIILLSRSGEITSWNRGAEIATGFSEADAIGRDHAFLYPPEAVAAGLPELSLSRAAAEGHFENEGWRNRKDGSRYWANCVVTPMRDAQGRLAGYSKITRDLTERRAQEQQLQDSERHLRLLVEGVQDYAIFTLDTHGYITSWNLGAQRIKGYAASEAIGKHFSIFYSRADVARRWPQEELRRAAESGKYEEEGWRYRRDGSRLWASVLITAIHDEQGTLLGYSKVTRDLTERRRHETNLRLLVDNVKDHAIILLDDDGRIGAWNEGARRMFGYDEAAILGHPAGELYTDEDRHAGRPRVDLDATRLMGSLQHEVWRRRADGTRFWSEVVTTEVKEGADGRHGFVQIARDLSQRRRLEELESEGRRINEFIAMLSHELRNPMAPVANAISILKRYVDRPETVWCADIIERQIGHMARLVDDLLDVSRVSTGKIRFDKSALELNELVQGALESSRVFAQRYGHSLRFVPSVDPVPVHGDRTRLVQVVTNLLTNACKYTPDGGDVVVEIVRDDATATLRVVDSGIGMPAELLQRAFDPFVQGERKLDRHDGGLGIGLTLVRQIVDAHGGTVSAASAGLSTGTTLTVTLPLAKTLAPPSAARETGERAPDGKRVLVVDDNRDAAESLAMLLRLSGHEVQMALDGPQAVEMARTGHPDVVLLDIGLPGMTGYEVARAVRRAGNPARLVAITGYGQDRDRAASAEAGFDAHLTKPIDPDRILAMIDDAPAG